MGFSITDSDGNVKSKTVFWGGMPIDVMTITEVDEIDSEDTGVMVTTEKVGSDGVMEVAMHAIEMGSQRQARKVYDLAVGHLKKNIEKHSDT